MLTSDTKRHIDAARQVLVGIVPDPKGQVDQITNALIYKFMDDMDQSAIRAGGKASFFIKDLEKYSWTSLMSSQLGNQEKMNMYVEAIAKFGDANQLPDLFRDIFKRAFLPYRDPETLVLFLKEISYFSYSHSEELGNAYEYLLSIMGSQGDAGQFRTPRHIIDFMVAVVDPGKDDTVLDPACGTAGFLISAYKHILAKHDGKDNETGKPNKKEKPLTPDERRKVMDHFTGYDISPDMVRMSQVNMYLHAFKKPKIYEYNTLASDDRWNEKFDVILANPPFMSPQGGVRPHNRFSVESSRAEVLFVDYIMTHLKPRGRGGIIVPEGVIFQSGGAYKKLRKLLIEDGLYAVVSLPSGVFNPYSGVKTSILFFDNQCSQKSETILFVDIKNTGVDLGATKKEIVGSDLPEALRVLHAHRLTILEGKKYPESPIAVSVKRSVIEKTSDYNFSVNRYRVTEKSSRNDSQVPFVALGEIAEIERGKSSSTKTLPGPYPLVLTAEEFKTSNDFDFDGEAVCVPLISATGHGKANLKRVHRIAGKFALANLLAAIFPKKDILDRDYLYWILMSSLDRLAGLMSGAANVGMKKEDLEIFKIPLPSIDIQRQIALEINRYQEIVDGSTRMTQNYRPSIEIDPSWTLVRVGDLLKRVTDTIDPQDNSGIVKYIGLENIESNFGVLTGNLDTEISEIKSTKNRFKKGDILFGKLRPNLNKVWYAEFDGICSTDIIVLRANAGIDAKLYSFILRDEKFNGEVVKGLKGAQLPRISFDYMSELLIPLIPVETQKELLYALDKEQEHIVSAKAIATLFEQKIKVKLNSVWAS